MNRNLSNQKSGDMSKALPKAIIEHSILVVNQFGLHASSGERHYIVDGLFVDDNDIIERRTGVVQNDFEAFVRTKINPFQYTDNNNVIYYHEE